MLDKVRKTISEFNMISEGETVLCCLSGGADSVTLLLCLLELGYKVRACHVNHQLRGAESQRDEKFCGELCARLGVKLDVYRKDAGKYSEENGFSVEEGARKLRYEIFARCQADKIATAHTLSDSMETALFNMARGTGIKGLCGIPPVRDNIIRPLICCTRQEVESFLEARKQSFVTDSTNLSDDYTRNKIRHRVVPVMREINVSAEKSFGLMSCSLRQDMEYLEAQAEKVFQAARSGENSFSRTVLNSADPAIKSRVVMRILSRYGLSCSHDRVREMIKIAGNGGRADLGGGLSVLCSRDLMRIVNSAELEYEEVCLAAVPDGEYCFYDKKIVLKIMDKDRLECNVNKKFANCIADYDKIKGEILLRNRRSGDRIKLEGRDFTSSVKKLFNERISAEKRGRTAMLSDDEGLFFIESFGIAERVKVTGSTKRLLICKIS
ncbi:tRNA lysidine(34) synthetase TilS [Ruminococcus sp. Marseille-P6503]|uniref:tRNA lysidine(34) synthetase TilS n=1 Tax=Ruminococcus sp. Marseille-P6503 TaxID=2364796 RepID=UPI001FAAFD88|nr:tRNA lysidine(34) synthetase TilS [Ruminococcus sp. Marseille-P6503]